MSIKKIAELAGTSTATVSRVLNHPEYRCAEEGLREKIWQIAIQLKYTPNEAARSLKRGVSVQKKYYHIDILMTRMDGKNVDPFFSELLRVVEREIHENVCVLSNVWYKSVFSDDAKCKKAHLSAIYQEMFEEVTTPQDGLIIIGRCNVEVLQELKQRYKNIVSINRNSTNYEVDEVLCDGKKIAQMALEYLISLGHKKLAYIGKCHGEMRYQGYIETMEKNRLTFYPEYIKDIQQTREEGFQAMQELLAMDDMPTGIYCANDITAVGVLQCLEQYRNGIYLRPSVISSDGIEESEFTTPMLSTIVLPKERMAKFALYLLLDRIKGGHDEVARIELEGKLVARCSCYKASDEVPDDYYI